MLKILVLLFLVGPAHAADLSWVDTPGRMPPSGWVEEIAAEEEALLQRLRDGRYPHLGEMEELRALAREDRDTRALYLFLLARAARRVGPTDPRVDHEAMREELEREVERARERAERVMEREIERAQELAEAEVERIEAIQEAISELAEDFDDLDADEQQEHKEAMKRLAAELFALRQAERRQRIEGMDARLDALRLELEAQEREREAIVERHLEELIRERGQ